MSSRRFADLIEEYDLQKEALPHHDAWEKSARAAMVEFATQRADLDIIKVLEAGAGTGLSTKEILLADRRIHLTSFDNEESMLAQARRRLLPEFEKRLSLSCNEVVAYLPGIASSSQDVFVSVGLVHNLLRGDRKKVLKHIARLLRPGGCLIHGDTIGLDDSEEHERAYKALCASTEYYKKNGKPHLQKKWLNHYAQDEEDRFKEGELSEYCDTFGLHDLLRTFRTDMEATFVAFKK